MLETVTNLSNEVFPELESLKTLFQNMTDAERRELVSFLRGVGFYKNSSKSA
ncbi:hypothetical protein [Turicibacter sanguinis]|uniref:hypothetical protein n=1 Tax=Turicibacter sanguinis TaxID=154288 RepID=UPI00232B2345|nr:hypothetical protein [Turicibacter sanguinis]MDB8575183.1 hypothetical protein [Turicibacter sanguinis]MDB8577276.1 hypothetical protein [Turicibacter sanguinis]MDB8583820.1 hypothetical protein [Turicibacter sanguinis]MDB8586604.1 hypothetical protein [Turicibacter sanguinis]MDB8597540.1 hypothetical protein [Turicibacter sanguinis]